MSRLKNVLMKIRNNWKKSVFGSVALVYGVNLGNEKYLKSCMLREYCETAAQFGEAPIGAVQKPRHITVILNPAANRRQAKLQYELYCAPILNLSGASVDVLQTTGEGGGRTLVEKLSTETDAIIVAGGDGTVSEVITGLLRRFEGNIHKALQIPIGILPLGRTNSVIKSLVKIDENELKEKVLTDAAMNVVNEKTKRLDVISVQLTEDLPIGKRPIYALSSVEWGALRNADAAQDKYWYYGVFRNYMSYLFHGTPKSEVQTELSFTPPCTGCNNCFSIRKDLHKEEGHSKKWWHYFLPVMSRQSSEKQVDYSSIMNPDCSQVTNKKVESINLAITTTNIQPESSSDIPHLNVYIAEPEMSYIDFVKKGFKRIEDRVFEAPESFEAHILELHPVLKTDEEMYFSIDNEPYEVRPVKITLLPKSINVFCS
nr:PREDICTED: acylglycerol kinase, mitochondrial [Bemisia tabaci]